MKDTRLRNNIINEKQCTNTIHCTHASILKIIEMRRYNVSNI